MKRIFSALLPHAKVESVCSVRVLLTGISDLDRCESKFLRAARRNGLAARIKKRGQNASSSASLEALLEGEESAIRRLLTLFTPIADGTITVEFLPVNGMSGIESISGWRAAVLTDDSQIRASLKNYHEVTRTLSNTIYAIVRAQGANKDRNRVSMVEMCEEILPSHLFYNAAKEVGGNIGSAGLSFATEIRAQSHFRKELKAQFNHLQEFELEEKKKGRNFADSLGLKLPKIYLEDVPSAKVEICRQTVIKPVKGGGSDGVFILDNTGSALHLKNRQILRSFGEIREAMEKVVSLGRADRWMVEERLVGPVGAIPTDIKVYCFYGRTPIALEVDRNGPSPRYFWHRHPEDITSTPAGPPPIGKYEMSLFESMTDPMPFFELASCVSKFIPAPFIRIDFLNTDGGPVYGEFTPRPGQFQNFHPRADRWLGGEFVSARARLFADVRRNKDFSTFEKFITQTKGGNK